MENIQTPWHKLENDFPPNACARSTTTVDDTCLCVHQSLAWAIIFLLVSSSSLGRFYSQVYYSIYSVCALLDGFDLMLIRICMRQLFQQRKTVMWIKHIFDEWKTHEFSECTPHNCLCVWIFNCASHHEAGKVECCIWLLNYHYTPIHRGIK